MCSRPAATRRLGASCAVARRRPGETRSGASVADCRASPSTRRLSCGLSRRPVGARSSGLPRRAVLRAVFVRDTAANGGIGRSDLLQTVLGSCGMDSGGLVSGPPCRSTASGGISDEQDAGHGSGWRPQPATHGHVSIGEGRAERSRVAGQCIPACRATWQDEEPPDRLRSPAALKSEQPRRKACLAIDRAEECLDVDHA